MFEKLFLLVKNNAGEAVMNNPAIAEKHREAVLNDASSSIIEVLKGQVEGGKLRDLVKYFQFTGIFENPLITSAVNKFANKLNNFYGIDSKDAMEVSKKLIPPVMQEMIKQSKGEQNKEFALSAIISKLNGNIGDISLLLNQLKIA
ncbi:hypothetical protein [Mucilaginibacter glaciei]|uniref:Uncharacterized protein n=1 Tax=Mucilaginibacter glaciei TaxID=2772109 RepID=A0A926S191_9SPHI|nr:hypothetical protein [Mucilaginibacter glaciei]MBD1392828.1 hypothetical protein [Mucilaginibacter glaciei]